MPALPGITGGKFPSTQKGEEILPAERVSYLPAFKGIKSWCNLPEIPDAKKQRQALIYVKTD